MGVSRERDGITLRHLAIEGLRVWIEGVERFETADEGLGGTRGTEPEGMHPITDLARCSVKFTAFSTPKILLINDNFLHPVR